MAISKVQSGLQVNPQGGSSGSGDVPSFDIPSQDQLKNGDANFYFQLMQQMQQEARTFEAMTNIINTRHHAMEQAIQGIQNR